MQHLDYSNVYMHGPIHHQQAHLGNACSAILINDVSVMHAPRSHASQPAKTSRYSLDFVGRREVLSEIRDKMAMMFSVGMHMGQPCWRLKKTEHRQFAGYVRGPNGYAFAVTILSDLY